MLWISVFHFSDISCIPRIQDRLYGVDFYILNAGHILDEGRRHVIAVDTVQNLISEIRQCNLFAVSYILKYPYGCVAPRVDNRLARSGNLPRHHDGC